MGLGLSFFLLALGLGLLWKTGDWSVTHAARFSVIYRIESFIIGFFLFAVATGLPEITSAIVSSIQKVPELSAGDLIGSTFVNTSLQMGLATFFAYKLPVEPSLRGRIIQTSVVISLIMCVLFFLPEGNLYLGLVLIAMYFFSFFWLPRTPEKHFTEEVKQEDGEPKGLFSPKVEVIIKLAWSLVLLIGSAWLTVIAAVSIAKQLHVPITLVGGTLVAVGTSLPEMTLEIHAVRRKEYGLALGDIFGSGLLNVSLVLGMLVLFNSPLNLSIGRIIFPFFAINILWVLYRLFRKQSFTLCDGIFFIAIFALYVVRIISTQFSVIPIQSCSNGSNFPDGCRLGSMDSKFNGTFLRIER